MPSDQTTVPYSADLEPGDVDDLPLTAVAIDGIELEGADVLGAATVQDADPEGGVWSVDLEAGFATRALSVAEVDERLEPGTYALVRVEGDDAE